jgi:hypothetical protein
MQIKVHPVAGSAIGYPADTAEIEFDGSGRARRVLLKDGEKLVEDFSAEGIRYLTGESDGTEFRVVARPTGQQEQTFDDATGVTFAHNVLIQNAPGRRLNYVSVTHLSTVLANYQAEQ